MNRFILIRETGEREPGPNIPNSACGVPIAPRQDDLVKHRGLIFTVMCVTWNYTEYDVSVTVVARESVNVEV